VRLNGKNGDHEIIAETGVPKKRAPGREFFSNTTDQRDETEGKPTAKLKMTAKEEAAEA